MKDLEGGVDRYQLLVQPVDKSKTNRTLILGPLESSVELTQLDPDTKYQIQLLLIIWGGATIASETVTLTTKNAGESARR